MSDFVGSVDGLHFEDVVDFVDFVDFGLFVLFSAVRIRSDDLHDSIDSHPLAQQKP